MSENKKIQVVTLSEIQQSKRLEGKYDAAQNTADNSRSWLLADGLSASSANSPGVRDVLRRRARYEIANNSYARGITEAIANDVIGIGPRLQVDVGKPEINREIEKRFEGWASSISLASKLRLVRKAIIQDGESIGLLTNNNDADDVTLDLTLVEADHLATPLGEDVKQGDVDGIEFKNGRPEYYHILKNHPGDNNFVMGVDGGYNRLHKDGVIHMFREDRVGQHRGLPEIMPALTLFHELRRYTLAVVAAAETAADFSAVLFTDSPAGGEAVSAEPFDSLEIEKRMMTTIPSGWKLGQFRAEQPTTTFPDFKREIINEVARCFNVPYNIAAGNSSGYNYASGRLDFQSYDGKIEIDRSEIERVYLTRIVFAWATEGLLIPGYFPAGTPGTSEWSQQWFWPGRGDADPVKDARSQDIHLSNLTTTLADEYAKVGQDWEVKIEQRIREEKKIAELKKLIRENENDESK